MKKFIKLFMCILALCITTNVFADAIDDKLNAAANKVFGKTYILEDYETISYSYYGMSILNPNICSQEDFTFPAMYSFSNKFHEDLSYYNFIQAATMGGAGMGFPFYADDVLTELRLDYKGHTKKLSTLCNNGYCQEPPINVKKYDVIYVPTGTTSANLVSKVQERLDAAFGRNIFTVKSTTLAAIKEGWDSDPEISAEIDSIVANYNPAGYCLIEWTEYMCDDDSTSETRKISLPYMIVANTSKMQEIFYKTADAGTDISISYKTVKVPRDAIIQASKVTSGEEYNHIAEIINAQTFEVYDISLVSGEEKITQLSDGSFEVEIPISSALNGKQLIVYYVDSDDNLTTHKVTVKNGKAVFKTNHFSIYTLAEVAAPAPDNNTNNNNNTDKPKTNQKNTIKIQVPLKGDDVIKGTPNEETNEVINKYPVYVTQTVEEEIKSISLTVGNKAAEVKEVTFEGTEEYNATKDGDKVTFELKEGQTGKSGKKELVGYVVVKLSKDVETPFTVTNKKVNGVKTGATLPIVSGIILIAGLGVILLVNKKNKSFRNI